jgi:PAS domain-containing protein
MPIPVAVEQILSGDFDSLPVSIEGSLLGRSLIGERQVLVLKSGRAVFGAFIRQPRGASAVKASAGSVLRVSGICLSDQGGNEHDLAFRVLVQSAAAVEVVQQPPWWTVPRALVVFGLLSFAILAGLVLNVALQRRKAAHRSRRELLDLTANLPGVVFQFKKMGTSIGKFLFISDGLESLCGRTAQEVTENAHLLLSSVYPEDARKVKIELRRALQTDTTFAATYRVRRRGQLRWLSATAIRREQETGGFV